MSAILSINLARRSMLAGAVLGGLAPGLVIAHGRGGFFDVRAYGAKGNGKALDTSAIQRAMDTAARAGGGTVIFPAGQYASYTLHLRSHVALYLSAGSVLLAAPSDEAQGYDNAERQDPAIEPFQDFGHNHWHNSLLLAEDVTNVTIMGEGLIWGRGLSKGPAVDGLPAADKPHVGNKAIAIKNCRHVTIRDISILKAGHFAVLATGVDDLVLDNLTVDTDRDGFDIDACRNVKVRGCRVNSPWDDGICLKSSYALGAARMTENVVISDCHVTGGYQVGSMLDGTWRPVDPARVYRLGRIKFGTESNGGFRNIAITNCIFEKCNGLAIETADGAIIEDVAISNLTMRECHSAPIFLLLSRRMRGPAGVSPGAIRRVSISNIVCSGTTNHPVIIAGSPDCPIEDIRIDGLTYWHSGGGDAALARRTPPEPEARYPEPTMFGPLPAAGAYVRHARNIRLSNLSLQVAARDERPAFWLEDVDGFAATGLRLPQGMVPWVAGASRQVAVEAAA